MQRSGQLSSHSSVEFASIERSCLLLEEEEEEEKNEVEEDNEEEAEEERSFVVDEKNMANIKMVCQLSCRYVAL